jgi:hypothetical protein
MKLFEMFNPAVEGYQDTTSDNSKPQWKETRKSKLTLRQVRKLRKMMDVRNFEHATNLKKVRKQYEPPAEPAAGM